jgi:hypothetical protein
VFLVRLQEISETAFLVRLQEISETTFLVRLQEISETAFLVRLQEISKTAFLVRLQEISKTAFLVRPPESLLTLNRQNIPFVNSAKYLGVIYDEKITWRQHIETVATKDYRTFTRLYSLFKSDRLSTKSTKRSIMTYACPVWELRQIHI